MKLFSGIGCVSDLEKILEKIKAKRCLLVTGGSSFTNSGASVVADMLKAKGPVQRFSDFCVNPKMSDALRGAALAKDFHAEHIVAVGGGSVLDMAKLIKAFLTAPQKEEQLVRGEISIPAAGLPLIAIPTTAGSGSEATHFAVAYIGNEKFSLASQHLLPNAVLLDGQLLRSASPYQRACSGLDALAQAIESSWAAASSEESRMFALEAIKILAIALPKTTKATPTDTNLQDMIYASHLAGKAINLSKTTAAHAFSYGFTSQLGVPHGHAVWLTLPEIFDIHSQNFVTKRQLNDPRGSEHLRHIIDEIWSCLALPQRGNRADTLRSFASKLGVEPDMALLGADTIAIRQALASTVNMERMGNNPVNLTKDNVAQIMRL